MKKVAILLFIFSGLFARIYAQTCTAVGDGLWTNAATWDCGIVPDGTITNIVIPAGITVTTPDFTTVNYDGQVSVYGTLTIGLFGDLNMALGSSVDVFPGGTVNSLLGTITIDGNSTLVTLFTPVPGPATIDETGQGPLPITLIFFKAESLTNKVLLTWATATEENFDYFAIERSADGERFKEITRIQGMGESGERVNYEFTDEFPLAGISYYRLRSVDFDGYTEIFDYKMVEVATVAKDFSVFPNPVTKGRFSLQTNFVTDIDLDLIVYSSMGKIEASFKVSDWLSTYDISDLQPGSYLVKLSTDDGTMVKRILVK
jgi:Secretion system C-terminal sorting domain